MSQRFIEELSDFWNKLCEIFEEYMTIDSSIQKILKAIYDVIFVDIPKLVVADVVSNDDSEKA